MKNVYVPYMKGDGQDVNDMILGVDFFRQYDKVTLNFKEMFMAVEWQEWGKRVGRLLERKGDEVFVHSIFSKAKVW